MPVSTAERAALESFFQSRRGTRVLIPASVSALTDYFATKGTTLRELPATRPADVHKVDDWVDEWLDTASAAGIKDTLDAKNLGRWISEEDSTATLGARSGKAFAVADALAKKGFTIDRAARPVDLPATEVEASWGI